MIQAYKHILVAVDGSDQAELAFKKGIAVAKRNDAELVLAHVIDTRAIQNIAAVDTFTYENLEKEADALLGGYEKTAKKHPESPLVGQVDALIDLLYLTYGSFVLMGVDPSGVFDIVHAANMGKTFPDGKAHFDPVTHKILKPDDWEKRFAPEPAIKREVDRQLHKALRRKASETSSLND